MGVVDVEPLKHHCSTGAMIVGREARGKASVCCRWYGTEDGVYQS